MLSGRTEGDFVADQCEQVPGFAESHQVSPTFPETCQDYNLVASTTLFFESSQVHQAWINLIAWLNFSQMHPADFQQVLDGTA